MIYLSLLTYHCDNYSFKTSFAHFLNITPIIELTLYPTEIITSRLKNLTSTFAFLVFPVLGSYLFSSVAKNATQLISSNSLISNMFLIYLEITDLSLPNNKAIWSIESHIVFSKGDIFMAI